LHVVFFENLAAAPTLLTSGETELNITEHRPTSMKCEVEGGEITW